MTILKAPENIKTLNKNLQTIFLAGSIEQGRAENWQKYCTDTLSADFNILNPRRDNWNPDLNQDIQEHVFYQQVTWELDSLESSDYVLMYLEPGTKSPISLMELGLMVKTGKMVVVCPDGFWRKGNVDILCHRYNVPQFDTLDEAISYVIGLKK